MKAEMKVEKRVAYWVEIKVERTVGKWVTETVALRAATKVESKEKEEEEGFHIYIYISFDR